MRSVDGLVSIARAVLYRIGIGLYALTRGFVFDRFLIVGGRRCCGRTPPWWLLAAQPIVLLLIAAKMCMTWLGERAQLGMPGIFSEAPASGVTPAAARCAINP